MLQNPTSTVMNTFRKSARKLDLGSPVRVLARPGDVIITHQRLGSAEGVNVTDKARKMVYFKISHVDFDELLDTYLEDAAPFSTFEGLKGVLDETLAELN